MIDKSNLTIPDGAAEAGEADVHDVGAADVGGAPAPSVHARASLPTQPPLPAGVDFEAADSFMGAKPGAVFTTREEGTGYYRDAIEQRKASGASAAKAEPTESGEPAKKKRKRQWGIADPVNT